MRSGVHVFQRRRRSRRTTVGDTTVQVDVWSDVMCPFCYLGEAHLRQAAERTGQDVEVRYHSFQLMPELPEGEATSPAELLERVRGVPRQQAEAMNAQVTERAAEAGLEYHLDHALATNTMAAHRLLHHAAAHGRQHALAVRLFEASFTEGRHVGDHEVLADLAADVGLDRAAALAVVSGDAHADDVADDIRQAREIGVTGVPFFVFAQKYAVSGAQPVEVFERALTTAAAG
jgi:predicted DsbA family dithiol-disulfide isomerase